MAYSYSKIMMFFILGSMAAIGIQSVLQIVYAQEGGETVIRRVEIFGPYFID